MGKFNFPSWLERTPDELQQEQQIQEQRRASFTRAKLTDSERMISRGALLEETARGNLDAARKTKGKQARAQEKIELMNLAHALSMQGRYEEAIRHHPHKRMKKYYQSIIDAIEMPDDGRCGCKDTRAEIYTEEGKQKARTLKEGEEAKFGGVVVSITPRSAVREVFSPNHSAVVSLIACSKCGHTNARKPQSRLLTSQSAMSQNIQAVKANNPRGLLSDSQVLRG
jgi:hypothetical protein